MQSHGIRKSMATKYPEKNPNYSPSTTFNYSPQTGFNANPQTTSHRRPEHFRKDASGNTNDRLIRQNDIIIKLLKEIRDRLPADTVVPQDVADVTATAVCDGAEAVSHDEDEKQEVTAVDVDDETDTEK